MPALSRASLVTIQIDFDQRPFEYVGLPGQQPVTKIRSSLMMMQQLQHRLVSESLLILSLPHGTVIFRKPDHAPEEQRIILMTGSEEILIIRTTVH